MSRSPAVSFSLSANVYGSSAVAVGQLMLPDANGNYVPATAANRTAIGRRSEAVALSAWSSSQNGTVSLQEAGTLDAAVSLLGVGAASWVRCSATGFAERFTPVNAGTSDVIGYCETDGRLHLQFGTWTETLAAGTPPAAGASSLESFGAKGDGTTDDAAAFTAALASVPSTNGALSAGAKTYVVGATNIVPVGAQISGRTDKSILYTTANATLLRLDVGAEDVNIRDLKLLGNATGAAQNAIECGRDGVAGTGIGRARFFGLTIENFGNYGMAFSRAAQTGILFYGPQVQNCRIRFCDVGILVTQSAEYIKASNTDIRDCRVGLYIGAGNFSGSQLNITACGTGVQLVPGTNDAHGTLVGCHINHNTNHYGAGTPIAVDVGAIAQGFTFSGCNIYQGDIRANGNTRAVTFDGCALDFTNIVNTNGKLRFVGCTFPGDYFVSCTESGTGWTEFVDCRGQDGKLPAFIDSRVNRVYAFATDANATLSWQDSVAENLIIASTVITAGRSLTSQWAPGDRRVQRVTNYTGFTVTFGWSTGTGIALATKTWALIGNDGNGNAMIIASGAVTGTGPYVAAGAFNPATLPLSLWSQGSFGGSPWAGVASTGTSGAKTLTTLTTVPTVGTAQGGYTPADFTPASTQALQYSGANLNTILSGAAYTFSFLVYPRNPVATVGGNPYADPQLIGDNGAVFGVAFTTSGVRAYHDAAGSVTPTGWVACSANAWHWIDVKYDGTNLMIRVDGGTYATVAKANSTAFSGSFLQLAKAYNALYADCKILDVMASLTAVSDANLNSIRTSYINTRYGLSL